MATDAPKTRSNELLVVCFGVLLGTPVGLLAIGDSLRYKHYLGLTQVYI